MSLPPTPPGTAWAMVGPAVAILPTVGQTTLDVNFNVNDSLGNPVLFEGEWVTVEAGPPPAVCLTCGREAVQLTCAIGPGSCPLPSNT